MKVGDLVRGLSLIRIGVIVKPWSHMGAIVMWNDGEYNFSSYSAMEAINESR